MTRKSEILRLKRIAVRSGGYASEPCSVCGLWKLESGNREAFERDYHADIRCKCNLELRIKGDKDNGT